MKLILEGIKQAFILIFTGNKEILNIIFLTLKVSGIAIIISLIIGIPLGFFVGLNNFKGKKFIVSLINTGMGLPPVAVGLLVSIFLWRSGPLGFLNLMFTPTAMIIAQIIIATPIISGITLSAAAQVNKNLKLQAFSLGANNLQTMWILAKEAKLPTLAAIMAGFGGIISEVGAVIMVGGNIKGKTQVLTTAIVQMVRMGKFEVAIAFVIILLIIVFAINALLTFIQQKESPWWNSKWMK